MWAGPARAPAGPPAHRCPPITPPAQRRARRCPRRAHHCPGRGRCLGCSSGSARGAMAAGPLPGRQTGSAAGSALRFRPRRRRAPPPGSGGGGARFCPTRAKMAPLDLDKYVEIARLCKYLPENDLKVRPRRRGWDRPGRAGAGVGAAGRAGAGGAGGPGADPDPAPLRPAAPL